MSLLAIGMSSVGLSLGPEGGINATRLALGDAPAVAAPADITGGVTEPPAPVKAASTPLMATMAEGTLTLCRYRSSERSLRGIGLNGL